MSSKEKEIGSLKDKIKSIFAKNESDLNKAKALFRRMFKSE